MLSHFLFENFGFQSLETLEKEKLDAKVADTTLFTKLFAINCSPENMQHEFTFGDKLHREQRQ